MSINCDNRLFRIPQSSTKPLLISWKIMLHLEKMENKIIKTDEMGKRPLYQWYIAQEFFEPFSFCLRKEVVTCKSCSLRNFKNTRTVWHSLSGKQWVFLGPERQTHDRKKKGVLEGGRNNKHKNFPSDIFSVFVFV